MEHNNDAENPHDSMIIYNFEKNNVKENASEIEQGSILSDRANSVQ